MDTDSWQVEGFECPVGMALFTAPELQNRKEYGLRTMGNENFAVATLLFMIMHPGKPPYAMQDGEGIKENIINGEFSYPLGEKKTGKVPKGPWRYCWSHLTYRIKEAFYQTFRYDGTLHEEEKRYGTGEWLKLFENYLELLQSGKYTAQDEESLEIFPTRFKKDINKKYEKCKLCGREAEENQLVEGICQACLSDGEHYKCKNCGRELFFTNYNKYIKHATRHELCHECFEESKHYMSRQCVICGREFYITEKAFEFYMSNDLALPRRCRECRGKN